MHVAMLCSILLLAEMMYGVMTYWTMIHVGRVQCVMSYFLNG